MTLPSTRRSVLVGSLPAPDTETAMTWAVDALGPDLLALPDGETGERAQWVAATIDQMGSNPALEVKREGGWTSYEDRPQLRIRRGQTLTEDSLDLGYLTAFEASSRPTRLSSRTAARLCRSRSASRRRSTWRCSPWVR